MRLDFKHSNILIIVHELQLITRTYDVQTSE